ncbi:hypothetical protein T09_12354 [Trichinella sp. T9]|nr:hypothetical protein T09_12354 [Trichinella sp. T9]
MTYRFTISDIEEVALSNFLTDDLHIDHYEDDILKSRSSSWKWNNMILPLADSQCHMSNTNDDRSSLFSAYQLTQRSQTSPSRCCKCILLEQNLSMHLQQRDGDVCDR